MGPNSPALRADGYGLILVAQGDCPSSWPPRWQNAV
jgi:hypothetical protein